MGTGRAALLLLVLVLCHGAVTMAVRFYEQEQEDWRPKREREEGIEGDDWFLLRDSKQVVQTDAGNVRVVKNFIGRIIDRPLHIGFITMEPKSLWIPQYLDSSLIIFIRRGEAKIGFIYEDALAERRLKTGDVYLIPAGTVFYLVNTAEGQRLHVVCSIDPSQSLGIGPFQSFYIGGGTYPASVLAGFDLETLATAFNTTTHEVRDIRERQQDGPIIFIGDSRAPRSSAWAKFLELKEEDRLQQLKRMVVDSQQEPAQEAEIEWSWRKLLDSFIGKGDKRSTVKRKTTGKSPDSCNIYGKDPDFRNNYGHSIALDESAYPPLKDSCISVYLVNLTAGAMMAPHMNPTATEYGIVLRGSGTILIVYPNGTLAMKAKVREGDVFWVPKFFPFCQIASRTGPFEFFGFTTSAHKNRPQFLVGASSILQTLIGPELAAAFGITEERLRRLMGAQRELVIIPSASAAPPDETQKEGAPGAKLEERVRKVMKSVGNDMVMGF